MSESKQKNSNSTERSQSDADWGFESESRGMAKETKIGLLLIVILLGAFGFVVYRKLDKHSSLFPPSEPQMEITERTPEDSEKAQAAAHTPPDDPDPFAGTKQAVGHDGGFEPQAVSQSSSGASTGRWADSPSQQQPPHAQAAQQSPFAADDDPFASPAQSRLNSSRRSASHSHSRGEELSPFDDDVQQRAPQSAAQTGQQSIAQDSRRADRADEFDHPFGGTSRASAERDSSEFGRVSRQEQFANQQNQDRPARQNDAAADSRQWSSAASRPEEFDAFVHNTSRQQQQLAGSPSVPVRQAQSSTRVEKTPLDGFGGAATDGSAGFDDFAQQRPFPKSPAAQNAQSAADFEGHSAESPLQANPTTGDPFGGQGPRSQPARSAQQVQGLFGGGTVRYPSADSGPRRGEPPPKVHTVQSGDNYWRISKKQYGTARYFKALFRYNQARISDPARLRPGMKVLVPERNVLESRYPDLFPARASASRQDRGRLQTESSSGFFRSDTGRPMYRVGKQDTLSRIAQRHLGRASRWIQIYHLNRERLSKPGNLKIGTELLLPADASRVQLVADPDVLR